jgi:hypothetical protein
LKLKRLNRNLRKRNMEIMEFLRLKRYAFQFGAGNLLFMINMKLLDSNMIPNH